MRVALLLLGLLLAGCGSAPAPTVASAVASPTAGCAVIVRDVHRSADGREHAEPAPDRVRVTTYADAAGTRWDEYRPPPGWDPVQATDQELHAFGFNPRPGSGPEREEWNRTFAGYRGSEPGEPPPSSCPVPGMTFGNPF